ncbi:MAG: two-component system sensor histidine kinase NtrB [Hyphomicrobiales bacterium]
MSDRHRHVAERLDLEGIRPILPQLIDSLNDAVLVVDRSRRIVAANRRFHEAFGHGDCPAPGDVCGGTPCCPEECGHDGAEGCAAQEVIRSARPTHRLRFVPDSTGTRRRWDGTFSPVLDAAGEVSHVVEVWRDVSERSRLEGQLSHSERLASLGILAAGVAHEINNPLASMLAGVEALRRRIVEAGGGPGGLAADVERLLAILEREARRVRVISDKLMMLAQPASESAVWVDLNRAADDTIVLLRYQMAKQGVRVAADLMKGAPLIWARESGLRSICMNLMMNAVQAMPEGGLLTVRTTARDGRVFLEVRDTGPGVPAEFMDRIWDPFFTTKPPGKGTGLGLSITQRVVARHQGTIRAENVADPRGARFVVELPERGTGGASG